MSEPLYSAQHNDCPQRGQLPIAWAEGLPPDWADQVVAPQRFDLAAEYEAMADRCLGLDAEGRPCYCAYRYVRTALRSDDDEIYFEAPVYAETLLGWRLADGRWLARRQTIASFDSGWVRTQLYFSEGMPR